MPNFHRFTIKAQEALQNAQEIAAKKNHGELKVIHLLAALLDEDHGSFREFGCMAGDATRHGLFVVDAKGLIRLGYVGDAPFEEIPIVIKAVRAIDVSKP